MIIRILFTLLFTLSAAFGVLIDPLVAMQEQFETAKIEKKSLLLTSTKAHAIQQSAQAKLSSKLFRVYYAIDKGKKVGVGVLKVEKVRSKTTAVLTIFDANSTLKSVEIVAFNEPKEYLPSQQFINTLVQSNAQKEQTITGATMTARAVNSAARISKAIVKHAINFGK